MPSSWMGVPISIIWSIGWGAMPAKPMVELRLLCPQDRIEIVSDALDALDALSVSVEDADAQTEAEQALFGEPGMPPPQEGWQRSRVVALFGAEAQAEAAAT